MKNAVANINSNNEKNMKDKRAEGLPKQRLGGYTRRDSAFLSNAELVFDDMTFIAGKGQNEKVILNNVGARITSGRVLAMMGPSGMFILFFNEKEKK